MNETSDVNIAAQNTMTPFGFCPGNVPFCWNIPEYTGKSRRYAMKKALSLFLSVIFVMSFLTIASADVMPESDYVFELDNAELYITLPEDYDNWTVIQDPASCFAISDGRDLITVNPLSDDVPESEEELWGEWFDEVYQEFSAD